MICEGGQSSLNYLLHVAGRIQQVLRVRMLGCVAWCCSYSVTGPQGRPRALLLILGTFHTRLEELARNDIDT